MSEAPNGIRAFGNELRDYERVVNEKLLFRNGIIFLFYSPIGSSRRTGLYRQSSASTILPSGKV